MLKAYQDGPVRIYKMGRNIGSKVLMFVHCYQIDNILIDTGTAYAGRELIGSLESQPVDIILNTHAHEDHTGNNHLVADYFGSITYAHPLALPYILEPLRHERRLYLSIVWNYPRPSEALPLGSSFSHGPYNFQVLHTPGHSPDHVCFYETNKHLLFTGDLFMSERIQYLRADEDFAIIRESVRQISDLDISTMYCSLAGPIRDPRTALAHKLEYMDRLESDVKSRAASGQKAASIRDALLGREGLMYYASAGHFSKLNMIKSILSENRGGLRA